MYGGCFLINLYGSTVLDSTVHDWNDGKITIRLKRNVTQILNSILLSKITLLKSFEYNTKILKCNRMSACRGKYPKICI